MSDVSDLNDLELWDLSTSGSEREKAEACCELSQRKLNRREFSDALALAQQGAEFYRQLSDDSGRAECLYYAGRSEYGQRNFTEALGYFEQASQLQRSNVNENYLASLVNSQGDCYRELGQYKLAHQNFENSAKLYASCNNNWWASNSEAEAAEMLLKVRDYPAAELAAAQSIEYAMEAEHTVAIARALMVRAKAYREQGNYDAAIEAMVEARAVSQYTDNHMVRHNLLRDYAMMLAERGMSPSLNAVLAELREITVARTDAECQAMADYVEALAAFNDFEMDVAQRLIRNAVVMLSYTKEHDWAYLALELQARIHYFKGELAEAVAAYEKAAEFGKKHNLPSEDGAIYMHRAQVNLQWGQPQAALTVLDEIPEPGLYSAMDFAVLDEVRSSACLKLYRYADALSVAERAEAILVENNPRSFVLGKVLETKGRAQLAMGSFDEAKATLQRAMQIHSLNESGDEAKALAELLFDLEGKATEQAVGETSATAEDQPLPGFEE